MAKTGVRADLGPKPEKFFQEDQYIYTNGELRDAIERFEQVNTRPVYHEIVNLFKSALKFRYAATADNMFARMRNQSESDEGLMKIFAKIQTALTEAEKNAHTYKNTDEKSLQQAMQYVRQSICKQMSELPTDDRLLGLWQKSALKKMCE